jgi:multidrug efflux pump subunit AcrA (membrane-fusion protein)
VPELPGRVFHGRLARNASALQDATRTVLAEVDVDNQDGTLAPGIYTIVRLDEPRLYPVISVPSQAIIFDNGLRAAVDDNGVARLRHLDIAADNGGTVAPHSAATRLKVKTDRVTVAQRWCPAAGCAPRSLHRHSR